MGRTLVLFAGLALIAAGTASAQMHDELSNRWISFGIGGGVSVPVSDAKDAFKNGVSGQGFVRFNLKALPIVPRVDFTFSKFDLDDAKIGTTGVVKVLRNGRSIEFKVPIVSTSSSRPRR